MPTFLQLRTEIIDELVPRGNIGFLNTAVSRAIVASQRYYEGKRFWFNEADTSLVTIPNQSFLTAGSSVIHIDAAMITYIGVRYKIIPKQYNFIDRLLFDTNITGLPKYYAHRNEQLYFYPIPDRSATLSLSYHRKLPDLPGSASGSTTTKWLVEGVDLIKVRAKIFVLENTIRDFVYAQVLRAQELTILDMLNDRTETQVSLNEASPNL